MITKTATRAVAATLVLAVLATIGPAVAQATEVHLFTGSFGGEGSGPGQFKTPVGVAVNDTTHDVYVVDSGNDRVQELNSTGSVVIGEFNGSASPTGVFSEPTQIAVDNSTDPLDPSKGDVYVVDTGHGVIDKFSSSGVYEGQLTGTPVVKNARGKTIGGPFEAGGVAPRAIMGVAVDPDGTVWVTTFTGPIYSFTDGLENKFASELNTVFDGAGEGLAVDAEDDLYLGNAEAVVEVDSSGKQVADPFGGVQTSRGGIRVAVDQDSGAVFLDEQGLTEATIEAFEPSGTPIESFGSGHITGSLFEPFSKGVGVDGADGTVYVTDAEDRVVVFEAVQLPTVAMGAVSGQTPRGVTLNGTVDPEGKPVTSCVFEYGTTSAYGQSVPCSPEASALGSGSSSAPVSAQLTGLTPGATYHYRLVAENVAHIKSSTPDRELVAGPVLGGDSAASVTSESSTLRASVDPNGDDAHYYFQYGTSVSYGSYAPVAPPGIDLGSVEGAQPVSAHLQGLQAATVYHYRLVVVQNGETFADPDHSFTTQAAGVGSALPDGREWELVSPVDKDGALIELLEVGGQVQAAADGSGITYMTQGPHVGEGPVGKITYSLVLSRRDPAGWGTADLNLPGTLPENEEPAETLEGYQPEYHLFSPDLSLAAVEPQAAGTPSLSPEANERTLYLRDNINGDFRPLVTAANVPPGTAIEEPTFMGVPNLAYAFEMHFLAATPDLGHVVFETPLALTPEAIDEESVESEAESEENPIAVGLNHVQWNLYEWGEGKLRLVNILPPPSGEVAHGPEPAVPAVRLAGTVSLGGLPAGGAQRAVSSDGRMVAWTWGDPYENREKYKGLYVRDMVEETTVRVGGQGAVYQTMNSEGSKVFFRENGDLWVFDPGTGTQTDLTAAHGLGEANAGVQEGVSDVSEDGSYVYFVATGVLANGGVSGADNLYLLHDTGSGWSTTFVAKLSPEDEPSWYTESSNRAPELSLVSSRVSPDGRYLAFMSNRSPTGYDNTDAVSGAADEEVYLYDASAGRLVCASCDPTGARPVGVLDSPQSRLLVDRKRIWTSDRPTGQGTNTDHWLAGSVPGWDSLDEKPSTYQPRYLSDSGRLFFDSPDGLVPRDTNGLEDVYEYEPAGVPAGEDACSLSSVSTSEVFKPASVTDVEGRSVEEGAGCVGLISSGTSSAESAFYDASESGDDVFFSTTGRLVGEDSDRSYDVYDAHVCTSAVPCRQVPVSSPPCSSGDSCKAAPSPQPEIFGPAPSATFSGTGNIAPESGAPASKKKTVKKAVKCEKGKKLVRGKCVRRVTRRRSINHRRAAR